MRKKMLARGMRNLGNAPLLDAGAGAAAPLDVPVDDSSLSPAERKFVAEVRGKAEIMASQSASARLGVSSSAPTEAIRQAYLAAAKKFHPDRTVGTALQGLHPALQRIFAALKEAYDAIASSEDRARYDQQVKAGPRSSARKDEAGVAMKMGEVLLKKRDFDGALNKLRRAVDLDPTGETLAALAWGLMSDPRPGTKEEAASVINRALRAPGVTARTHYVAGVIWRTKDPDSAVDAFRRARPPEPGPPHAALDLRLIDASRGTHGATALDALHHVDDRDLPVAVLSQLLDDRERFVGVLRAVCRPND